MSIMESTKDTSKLIFSTWISVTGWPELSPPKRLDQSKNVTVRTFQILSGVVYEHIFWPKVAKKC